VACVFDSNLSQVSIDRVSDDYTVLCDTICSLQYMVRVKYRYRCLLEHRIHSLYLLPTTRFLAIPYRIQGK
jgi:hypothetical protein